LDKARRLTVFVDVGPINPCGGIPSCSRRRCKIAQVADGPVDVVCRDEC
jgi:hypothetical protein